MSIITATNERMNRRQSYVNPFRPHFEKGPAIAWSLTTLVLVLEMLSSEAPKFMLVALSILSATQAYPWIKQWLRLMETHDRMRDREAEKIPISEAIKLVDPEKKKILVGWGFNWNVDEAQLAREVAIADPTKLLPEEDIDSPGAGWLHGVGSEEAPIYLPVADEHTLIVAMTRWGKTVLFRFLILQAILRGEAVFIIDPKGDKGMREAARQACEATGTELLEFNTAYPQTSVRLDPLRNFDDASELASRISGLLGRSSKDQNFTAFANMVLVNVVNGMLTADERPTLVGIKSYLDNNLEVLLVKAIRSYCSKILEPGWVTELDGLRRAVKAMRKGGKKEDDTGLVLTQEEEGKAVIAYYRDKIQNTSYASTELEGLIATVEHDAEHRSKMTASLMPVLTKLTSGPMARLLSTNVTDPGDTRMITDTKRIIEQRRVCYVGLNSMGNEDVANALGEILLADLAAVAGSTYNYSSDKKKRKDVAIFADEAAQIFNAALIKLLNKGGGAGYRLTMAVQTISDIVTRLGDAAAAEQVIGNVANLIFGRTTSADSQEFFCNRLPKVPIKSMDYTRGVSSPTEDPNSYQVSQGETLKTAMEPPIEPSSLGALPRFHFFALIGSRFLKGRIPLVIPDPVAA